MIVSGLGTYFRFRLRREQKINLQQTIASNSVINVQQFFTFSVGAIFHGRKMELWARLSAQLARFLAANTKAESN